MVLQPLPQQFRGRYPSSAVLSFNYTDIAEGTGVKIFYATVSEDTSGKEYILTDQMIPTAGDIPTGTREEFTGEQDFDLGAFNIPKVIKGTAYLTTWIHSLDATDGYVKVKLKKFDGTTETDISAEYQSPTTNISSGQYVSVLLKIPVTETQFKKGEILRATITHVSTNGSGSRMTYDASGSYPLRLFIPFKIDL